MGRNRTESSNKLCKIQDRQRYYIVLVRLFPWVRSKNFHFSVATSISLQPPTTSSTQRPAKADSKMAGKKETLEQWWRRHNRHREEENRRPRPYVLGQANCCITPRIPEPNLELIERQRLQTSILEGMRQTDSSLPDYLRDCDGPTDDHCEEETWPPYPYVLEQSTCSITPSSPEPNPSPELNGGRSLQTDILESMREMSSLPDFWRDCGGDIDEYTSRMVGLPLLKLRRAQSD